MKWHPPLLWPTPPTLEEIESRLLAQEHRPLAAYRNLLYHWNSYPKGDPRRKSILISVIHCTLFSSASVATAGTLAGLATLALLFWQNNLIRDANALVQRQLATQQEQFQQQQGQLEKQESVRRAEASHGWLQTIYSEDSHPTLKADALGSYLSYLDSFPLRDRPRESLVLKRANLQSCEISAIGNVRFDHCLMDGCRLSRLDHCIFEGTIGKNTSIYYDQKLCQFNEVDFSAVIVSGVFDKCVFRDCDLSSITITTSEGVRFHDCFFKDCDLSVNGTLKDAIFTGTVTISDEIRNKDFTEMIRSKFKDLQVVVRKSD